MTGTARTILLAVTVLILLAGTVALRTHLDTNAANNDVDRGPIYLPRAEYLRPLSLGYHNVLADILWFRAINYFGKHYRQDRTYPWLGHMCELVTDLDPNAKHVYRFAGLILPWEVGDVDGGIRILEKGVKALPNSWELAYYLGFNYFFFQNDAEKAAEHFQRAAKLPDAHHSVSRLAAVLTTEASGPDKTLAFLRDLQSNIDSPQVRKVVDRNLRETAAAKITKQLDEAIALYTKSLGHPPNSIEDLVRANIIHALPPDPLGGTFEIGPDGSARSSTGQSLVRPESSPLRLKALSGKRGPELID